VYYQLVTRVLPSFHFSNSLSEYRSCGIIAIHNPFIRHRISWQYGVNVANSTVHLRSSNEEGAGYFITGYNMEARKNNCEVHYMIKEKYGTGRFKAQSPDFQTKSERITGNLPPQRTTRVKLCFIHLFVPNTVAVPSKAQNVFVLSNSGFVSSKPTRGMDINILLNTLLLEGRQRGWRIILK
jgi:hypothetical protein